MKLNLGCGRVIFPLERGAPSPYPAHLDPLPDICYEPGWINVDRFSMAGVNEQIDLFAFPWLRSSNGSPWNDDAADAIYCSHLVEHVPHQVRLARALPARWHRLYDERVQNLDGWFVFFAECWRILKPDGLLYVRAPFAASNAALSAPTHTRYVTPGTFSYLTGDNPDAPFDYHAPLKFEQAEPVLLRFTEGNAEIIQAMPHALAEKMIYRYFNVADEIRIVLRAVKGDRDG